MTTASGFRRSIGLFDAIMLVAGSMIGSGVFIVAGDMIRTGGTGSFLVWAWVLTGVLTVFGALSYASWRACSPKPAANTPTCARSTAP